MPLINCKINRKLSGQIAVFLSANSNDHTAADPKNIIFAIKNKKVYVPAATLSAKDNKKLTKLLSKGFERSVYWNQHKTKNENKNTANEYIYFLKSNSVEVNRLFVLIYSNQDDNAKT